MSQTAYSQQAPLEPRIARGSGRHGHPAHPDAGGRALQHVGRERGPARAGGVTDIASLATEVPGLSMYDYGARLAGATVPIIRGINATGEPTRGFRTFEQAPVGTYIGNSPIDGYFQLDDVKQVEVLRGPQGTLYGAGALGGALRIIPNSPELNELLGRGRGQRRQGRSLGLAPPYTLKGMVNLPLGDVLAFRAVGEI